MRHHPNQLLLALLVSFSSNSFALSSDKDQPIELAADSVDVDEAKGHSVYKGDVELKQGSIHLRANKVTVKQNNDKPNLVVATGSPVHFQQRGDDNGKIKAKAKRIEYTVNSELLLLIGNASLTQRGDTIKSDRITYDRVRHKIKAGAAAKGKQRVKITIAPPK